MIRWAWNILRTGVLGIMRRPTPRDDDSDLIARLTRIEGGITRIRQSLNRSENKAMAENHTLDDLLALAAAQRTSIDSLTALLGGIKTQLDQALSGATLSPLEQARVDRIFSTLAANKEAVDAAMTANTPAEKKENPDEITKPPQTETAVAKPAADAAQFEKPPEAPLDAKEMQERGIESEEAKNERLAREADASNRPDKTPRGATEARDAQPGSAAAGPQDSSYAPPVRDAQSEVDGSLAPQGGRGADGEGAVQAARQSAEVERAAHNPNVVGAQPDGPIDVHSPGVSPQVRQDPPV